MEGKNLQNRVSAFTLLSLHEASVDFQNDFAAQKRQASKAITPRMMQPMTTAVRI